MPTLPKIGGISTTVESLKPITDWLNRTAQRANTAVPFSGGAGISVNTLMGAGSSITANRQRTNRPFVLYKILATGPAAASDYTDNRYWLQEAFLVETDTDGSATLANPQAAGDVPIDRPIVTGTNVAEDASHTHNLVIGSFVYAQWTPGLSPNGQAATQLIFASGGSGEVVVKITSAASGGGKYNGRLFTSPTSDVSASGNLSAGDIGVDPGADDCLILNLNEVGQSTHILTDVSNATEFYFVGSLRRVNSDGKRVVAINGFFGGC